MITVRLDVREFKKALSKMAERLPKELQSAVNKSARAARTEFLRSAAKELNLKPRLLNANARGSADITADFNAARAGNLRAVFWPSKKTHNIAATGSVKWHGKGNGPLRAETHLLSGGGSSHLSATRGVVIKGRAFHRVDKGSHNSLKGLKQLSTTSPATVMAQGHNPVRAAFGRTAARMLNETIPVAIENAAKKAGFE